MVVHSVWILVTLMSVPAFAQKKDTTNKRTCVAQTEIPPNQKSLSNAELQAIQRKLKQGDSLKVKFKQTIDSPMKSRKRSVYGEAMFAKPAKFVWRKNEPREEFWYDGKDVIIHLPSEKVTKKFSALGSQALEFEKLTSMALNLDKLLERYDAISTLQDKNTGLVTIVLEPKGKESQTSNKSEKVVDSIVQISPVKNLIEKVCLSYADEKVITYEFSDADKSPIHPDKFDFRKQYPTVKPEVFD